MRFDRKFAPSRDVAGGPMALLQILLLGLLTGCSGSGGGPAPSLAPTPSSSATLSPSSTPTPTAAPTSSHTASPTPTATATVTPAPAATATAFPAPSSQPTTAPTANPDAAPLCFETSAGTPTACASYAAPVRQISLPQICGGPAGFCQTEPPSETVYIGEASYGGPFNIYIPSASPNIPGNINYEYVTIGPSGVNSGPFMSVTLTTTMNYYCGPDPAPNQISSAAGFIVTDDNGQMLIAQMLPPFAVDNTTGGEPCTY